MNIFTYRTRYLSQGRQLMFGDDKITVIGPLWEYSTNLEYNIVSFKILYFWLGLKHAHIRTKPHTTPHRMHSKDTNRKIRTTFFIFIYDID